jgi:hypothetical protein
MTECAYYMVGSLAIGIAGALIVCCSAWSGACMYCGKRRGR